MRKPTKKTAATDAAPKKVKASPSAEKKKPTKTDLVYEKIRMLILTRKYPPGREFSATIFTKDYSTDGYVKATIQTAINRLKAEDLLEVIPQQGVRVCQARPEDIPPLLFLRVVNECCVALALIDKLTASTDARRAQLLKPLRKSIGHMSLLVGENPSSQEELMKILLQDMEFHQLIARQASYKHGAMVIRRLQNHVLVACPRTTELGHMPVVIKEHTEILDAIASRQKDDVIKNLRNHIVNGAIDVLPDNVAQMVAGGNTNTWVEDLKKSLP